MLITKSCRIRSTVNQAPGIQEVMDTKFSSKLPHRACEAYDFLCLRPQYVTTYIAVC